MHTANKILLCGLLAILGHTLNGQYITLKEKQFYDQNGATFYPVICNYVVNLTCNDCSFGITAGVCEDCPLSNFELHPSWGYGNDGTVPIAIKYNEDFTEGVDKIRADFEKMLDMGFNTVRVLWLTVMFMDAHKKETRNPVFYDPDDPFWNTTQWLPGGGGKIICHNYADPTNGQEWYGVPLRLDPPPYNAIPPFASTDNLHRIFFPKIHELLEM